MDSVSIELSALVRKPSLYEKFLSFSIIVGSAQPTNGSATDRPVQSVPLLGTNVLNVGKEKGGEGRETVTLKAALWFRYPVT